MHSDGKDIKKSEWKHSPFTFYCLNLLFPSYISRNGEYAVERVEWGCARDTFIEVQADTNHIDNKPHQPLLDELTREHPHCHDTQGRLPDRKQSSYHAAWGRGLPDVRARSPWREHHRMGRRPDDQCASSWDVPDHERNVGLQGWGSAHTTQHPKFTEINYKNMT